MKLLKDISKSRAGIPVLSLLLASVAGVAMVGVRVAWSGRWDYVLLIGNLFLAWLPLLFALGACSRHQSAAGRDWRFFLLSALWLLFFPNAPYIFTDLIHLNTRFYSHYWVDLSLILLVALTGFMTGFVSLYLMQTLVAERLGRTISWVFILAVAGLSGVGIYLGRFLRWNSWDAVLHPLRAFAGHRAVGGASVRQRRPAGLSRVFRRLPVLWICDALCPDASAACPKSFLIHTIQR